MDLDLRARRALGGLNSGLIARMLAEGSLAEVPAGAELLHEGSTVRQLPIVLEGLVRVTMGHEDKELLLYWIQPAESCVMSFSALLERAPSRITAVAEQPSLLLLVPDERVHAWLREQPEFAGLILHNYAERYADMLRTVEQVAFGDLPTRLLNHLRRMAQVTGNTWLDVRHARLAQELGSAREVISRTLRKLEQEGRIEQGPAGIRLKQ